MPDSPTSNGSHIGAHGVPIVTIRSPQLTGSIHSEPEESAWSHAFGSIAVDAPEPSGRHNQECPDTEGGLLTDPPNADAQEAEPAQPHAEAVPPSEANTDPSEALPSLRSIFCALVNRIRESFASAPTGEEPIVLTPDNDATTAPPLDREATAPSVAEHGMQEETDTGERDSPAMPPTTEAETPARGLSIRLLDVGTSPLRPALRHPSSDEHTERDTQPASDAPPEASAETTDTPRPAQFLLYIPRAASPFPFGFLYDAESSMAWPILDHDSSGIADGQPRTVHVVGLPFHMTFAFRNAEPEERPDPARAASYVKSLEPVDAELRLRMSRFGISDIGLYGGFDVADGPVTGCGICLEPYASDDRPAWFAGEERSANESVVVVPCHGHHTLHRACLQGWLENTAPGKWSCPFCRTNLHKCAEEKELVSLREHVRAKERTQGWRCDAPACLPCYEDDPSASRTMGNVGMEWVTMLPCRHEVHMDCLCTGMSVETCESLETDDYDTGSESDSDLDTPCDMSLSHASLQPPQPPHASPVPEKHNTVGKWVTCPSCRKDAWAQLPGQRPGHLLDYESQFGLRRGHYGLLRTTLPRYDGMSEAPSSSDRPRGRDASRGAPTSSRDVPSSPYMSSPLAIRPDMHRSESARRSRRSFVHSEDSASNIRRASLAPTIREHLDDNEDVESFERRDDEHKARDRGEALIRHRMRERKREKLKKQKELGNDLGRSYTPESVDSQMRGSQANSAIQSHDYFPDSMRSPKSMRRPEHPASTQGDDTMSNDDDDEPYENEMPFDDEDDEEHGDGDEDDEDLEYTLKDRQDALNFEHPFGLPIWKPALYKKSRSITRTADSALKCMPGQDHGSKVLPGNIFWFVFFGIWLGALCFILSGLLRLVPRGGAMYSRVLYGLATYIMWPFGNYVELECTHQSGDRHGPCHWAHIHEHDVKDDDSDKTLNANNEPEEGTLLLDGAGSSTNPSYGAATCNEDDADEDDTPPTEEERIASERDVYHYVYDDHGSDVGVTKRWVGIIVYAIVYTLILFPVLGLVCLLCWGLVVTIPMAKLTWVLMKNMATQPLAMHFRSPLQIDTTVMRVKGADDGNAHEGVQYPLRAGQVAPRLKAKHRKKGTSKRRSMILLCNYRAVGKEYFKYTIGGVNILFINTLPIVFFTIFAFFLLRPFLKKHDIVDGIFPWVTSDGMIFFLSLCSVLPLSYFIGMAVASISTQSSIGMGAVINATFGSIIELLLYSIALTQGRAGLVEGSLIGSILAGVLLMPGLSMCSGATRRKEQKFNAQSAGVTSTMLIMAIIGILTPTIFYQIYGTFELQCSGCPDRTHGPEDSWMCRQCSYEHLSPVKDPFFQTNVKGLIYTCAVVLILAYGVGLWFSLRTHASQIWNNAQPVPQAPANAMPEHMPPGLHRASVYKRMMPAHVMQQLLPSHQKRDASLDTQDARRAHDAVQSLSAASEAPREEQWHLPPAHEPHEPHEPHDPRHQGTREGEQGSKKASAEDAVAEAAMRMYQYIFNQQKSAQQQQPVHDDEEDEGSGGHDAPSWSRMTALSVLLGCTVLYAIIAEILVDVVDVVVKGSGLPEKFIGVTIFALVPNTTEFMNAMSFAINGNIALSLEIGSAYVLQVCLIQIPVLVGFSAWYSSSHSFPPGTIEDHMFTLIFPRWDIIAILLSIFLLTYTYIEARSNYHRGSILILAYIVFVAGFFFSPSHDPDAFIPDTKPGVMSWVLS